MPQFMITYLGGERPATSEEGKVHFEKYVMEAGSLEKALTIAKDCPFLDRNGTK